MRSGLSFFSALARAAEAQGKGPKADHRKITQSSIFCDSNGLLRVREKLLTDFAPQKLKYFQKKSLF
ncbi:MAG: hypothetical protein KGN33_10425 [Paracoccaceae bacterium]|nr:hypothetical protein [Paracoccaceae bacterium]